MPPKNIHEPKTINNAIATYHNVAGSSFKIEITVGTGVWLEDIDGELEARPDGLFVKDLDGD